MVRLFGVKILDSGNFSAIEEELQRLNTGYFSQFRSRYKNATIFQHSFFGDLLVRMLLSKLFQITNSNFSIAYNDHNKPFLTNLPNHHFNISHSGSWVVAAFSEKPVGIDIEKIKKANFEVAERFFSDEEVAFLDELDQNQKDEWFFRFWTAKESYLKAIGTGLSKPLSSFVVKFTENNLHLLEGGIPVNVALSQLDFDGDYKLSVCAFEDTIDDKVEIIELADLLEFYRKFDM